MLTISVTTLNAYREIMITSKRFHLNRRKGGEYGIQEDGKDWD
jgi:hypothetical protein